MPKLNFSRFRNKHFLVLSGNGILSIVGLATSFLLFHSLPIADVGIWYFIIGWVAMCEAGRYGFLATATITFYAGAKSERAETVLGSVWFLALALSGAILILNLIAFLFIPYIHNTEVILCIKWIGVTFLSSVVYDIIVWRLQAEERYGTMLMLRMVNSISSILVFILLVVLHKMTLETALIFNLLTNCLTCLIGVLKNLAGFKTIFHCSRKCIMELVHFGKYTLGSTFFSSLLGNSDTFILNFMIGPAAVAVYNLAMRLMAFVEIPLRTFTTTGMSQMAIAFNAQNMQQLTQIIRKFSGMLTIAFIPLAALSFVFAGLFIQLLGGEKYVGTEAANAYRLVMILAIAYPFDRFNGLALDVMHKTKINFYKVIVMLVVKVFAGFIFMAILKNVYGIVIANYLSTITAILFGYYHLRKYLNYSVSGTLATGYSELKTLVIKNLKSNK